MVGGKEETSVAGGEEPVVPLLLLSGNDALPAQYSPLNITGGPPGMRGYASCVSFAFISLAVCAL